MSPWPVLAGALLTQIAIALINQGIPTLAPFLRADLALSNAQVGLLNTAIFGGFLLAGVGAGSVSDRIGPRRVLVAGTAAAALMVAAVASVRGGFVLLAPILVVLGIVGVGITPAGTQAVARSFPVTQRGLAISLRQMGVPLGGALAAALLPAIAAAAGWRTALLVVSLLTALAAAAAWPLLRRTPPPLPKSERPSGRPRKVVWVVSAAGAILPIGQFVMITYLLLWLGEVHGVPIAVGAALLSVANLLGAGSRVAFSALSDRLGRGRKPLLLPVVGAIAAAALTLSLLPSGTPTAALVAAVLAFALVALGWQGLYFTLVAELAAPGAEGRATGLAVTFTSVGIMTGPALFGLAVDLAGWNAAWRGLAGSVLVGVAVLAAIREEGAPGD